MPDQQNAGKQNVTEDKNKPAAPKSLYRKVIRGMLLYLMIPYLAIFGLLFFLQRSLIYPGSSGNPISISHSGFSVGQVHDIQIKADDGIQLNGWFILPDGVTAKSLTTALNMVAQKNNVIFNFPGNAGNRQTRIGGIKDFTRLGFAVFIVDYRGYADNTGSPSQKWMMKDALAQWKFLTKTHQIPPGKIFFFGESLGGAVAIQTVSELCKNKIEPGGLLVSSSFSSLADVSGYHYHYFPIGPFLLDQWKSKKEIANITCPVSILHGTADQIVPIQFGKSLFEAAPLQSTNGIPKKWKEIPGGTHNAVPGDEIRNAILKLTGEH